MKRQAPEGHTYINKTQARNLWEDDRYTLTIHGSNVNSSHVFGGWGLGWQPSEEYRKEKTFEQACDEFMANLDSELGRYPVFLVEGASAY